MNGCLKLFSRNVKPAPGAGGTEIDIIAYSADAARMICFHLHPVNVHENHSK
ncbi:hypothetical protein BH23CHL4_BH23CHL4_17710 [soil metagenome]